MLDLLALLPSAALDGGGDPQGLLLSTGVGRAADPGQVTVLLAALAGLLDRARRAPRPALPGLRETEAAQGEVALTWLLQRTGRR